MIALGNNRIQIHLFGTFEIVKDGSTVLEQLRQAKKTCLFLEYLILKRDVAVPHEELLGMLWSERDSRNPATALRTLLHRYRSIVDENGLEELSDSVITLRGAYQWNPALKCTIDIYEFERLCRAARGKNVSDDDRIEMYEAALALYTGPLLANSRDEVWVVPKSVYYHGLYFESLLALIELLKARGAYDRIVLLCRKAMDVDSFDERLQYELMLALVKTGKKREALSQYESVSENGRQQPEQMRAAYQRLLAADAEMEADLERVRVMLEETPEDTGAFVCSYEILRDIYLLERRMIARSGSTLFLGVLSLRENGREPVGGMEREHAMAQLLNAARLGLRCGDILSRYSVTQYVVLLPAITYETGKQVLDRVRKAFYEANESLSLSVSYKLRPLNTALHEHPAEK